MIKSKPAKAAPAPEGTEPNADAFGAKTVKPTFKRLEAVTVPTFSISDDGTPAYIRFIDKIETKPNIDINTGKVKVDPDTMKELEISVVRIVDLTVEVNDENPIAPMETVLGVILVNDLHDKYPDDSYVGMSFEIRKTVIKGKRAKAYQVWKIEV